MATGSGKTTVMGMLAAWSILNKLNDAATLRLGRAGRIVNEIVNFPHLVFEQFPLIANDPAQNDERK